MSSTGTMSKGGHSCFAIKKSAEVFSCAMLPSSKEAVADPIASYGSSNNKVMVSSDICSVQQWCTRV